MIAYFKNDDYGFKRWLRDNPDGYVYNDFGGSNIAHKKLHSSQCRLLQSVYGLDGGTNVRKVCSSDLDELVEWADKFRGPEGEGYTPCSTCHPFTAKSNQISNNQAATSVWA
jgi:hypothetical protein